MRTENNDRRKCDRFNNDYCSRICSNIEFWTVYRKGSDLAISSYEKYFKKLLEKKQKRGGEEKIEEKYKEKLTFEMIIKAECTKTFGAWNQF